MTDDAAAATAAIEALRNLTAETFDPLIGATLTLADDADGRLDVTLGAVSRRPEARYKRDARTPFSLILHGPADRPAHGGSYFLCHESLPALPPLLVTPIVNPEAPCDDSGRPMATYQIVFT